MDQTSKNFRNDILALIVFLVIIVAAYIRLDYNPSILFAGSLAMTFYVMAIIVLTR